MNLQNDINTDSCIIIINKHDKKIELSINSNNSFFDEFSIIPNNFYLKKQNKWFFEGTNGNYLQIIEVLNKNDISYKIKTKEYFDEEQTNPIVKHYVQTMIMRNNSKNTINQYINCIKIYYEKGNNRNFNATDIFRPKRPKELPEILSLNEMQILLSQIKNLKHYCLLAITYSGGREITFKKPI